MARFPCSKAKCYHLSMKHKQRIIVEFSCDSPNPLNLTTHFVIFLKNVLSVFADDFASENVTITVKESDDVV